MPGELPVPPAAAHDPDAAEIARIWASKGAQHVSLAPDLWKDPAAWGVMLVDLARHVANLYQELGGRTREDVLRRVRAGFDAEWQSKTSEATGSVRLIK
jgi:hypothetical protein